MPRVRLRLNAAAQDDWLAAVSTEFPDAEFRVLASHPTTDGLLGIVEIQTQEVDAIVHRFENASAIRSYDVIDDDDIILIQYVIPVPESYDALRESQNLPRFPATMQDGWLETEMSASQERLSSFAEALTVAEIPYQILSLTQSHDPVSLLTMRQREFITEAVARGYYDSPRGCTLTELAETFSVNKSAASGVLHRAEGRIIKEFVTAER